MIVMPGNDCSYAFRYLAGQYNRGGDQDRLGWLMGPKAWKRPFEGLIPYALDNDCFSSRDNWNVDAWREMLQRSWACTEWPRWALVPDVVGDRKATLQWYEKYSAEVKGLGFAVAFAVQDGMSPGDVPAEADVVFVGGSTDWKWYTVERWCKTFPRVHVGRVNSVARLGLCAALGAESVDGTGWFRNPSRPDQLPALKAWLAGSSATSNNAHAR